MSEYVKLIDQARDLLDQLLNDTKYGQVILKGVKGLSDFKICKPQNFNTLPLGTVITIGICEYFLVTDGLKSKWVSYDMRRVFTYRDMYIELVKAQESNTPIFLRHKGA